MESLPNPFKIELHSNVKEVKHWMQDLNICEQVLWNDMLQPPVVERLPTYWAESNFSSLTTWESLWNLWVSTHFTVFIDLQLYAKKEKNKKLWIYFSESVVVLNLLSFQ